MSAPYPWPVKPFDRQHPVRAFFNDPRIEDASHAFHFGIDISAPDGTAVYAVAPGRVFIEDKGHALAVQGTDGRTFGYWHVVPAVAHHDQVGLHQLLGDIEAPWGHVHFAESLNHAYRDPIRPGALQPFVDVGHPTIDPRSSSGAGAPQCSPATSEAACRSAASPTTRRRSPCRRPGPTCRWHRPGCATASSAPGAASCRCAPASTYGSSASRPPSP